MRGSILRRGSGPRQRSIPLLLALLAAPPSQPGPARYRTDFLSCAAYAEQVRTSIHTESGSNAGSEATGRDGVLLVRASPGDGGGIPIEAWYDSLVVWRETPTGRVAPETDGLIGGRWSGVLAPAGAYRAGSAPFIPDEVAAVADLRAVLEDFFPRLPDRALRDREHYEWSLTRPADTTAVEQDSLQAVMRRETSERGSLTWAQGRGPVHWERTLTISVRITPQSRPSREVKSTVTQRIEVRRLPNSRCS